MRIEELLDRAMAASQGGRKEEARDLLVDTLAMDPGYLEAWLRLAELAASPERAALYYQRAAAIDPRSLRVQKGLTEAQGKLRPPAEQERQATVPIPPEEEKGASPRHIPVVRTALPPNVPIFVDRELAPFILEQQGASDAKRAKPASGSGSGVGVQGPEGSASRGTG